MLSQTGLWHGENQIDVALPERYVSQKAVTCFVYTLSFSVSLILSVLHQHFLSEESGLNNRQLHYFLSKELAYEARKKEDKKNTQRLGLPTYLTFMWFLSRVDQVMFL